MGVLLFSGCAGSRYQQMKQLQDQGRYEDVVNKLVGCSKRSPDCFRMHVMQAESFYHLGKNVLALDATARALEVLPQSVSMKEVTRLYLLRSSLQLEELDNQAYPADRIALLRQAESELRKNIEANFLASVSQRSQDQFLELHLRLAETLLRKMDYFTGMPLEMVLQHLTEETEHFPHPLREDGYSLYYLISGELKRILPTLNSWGSAGNPVGTRESLLEQLKKLYVEAVQLRNLPIYEQGYSEKIDDLLKRIDFYMQQLIL